MMQLTRDHKHSWQKTEFKAHASSYFCFCGATAKQCKECSAPVERAPELDKAYAAEGTEVWIGYKCTNGHETTLVVLDD